MGLSPDVCKMLQLRSCATDGKCHYLCTKTTLITSTLLHMLAGYYALQEITAVLDTQLVKDPLGSTIMDKLRSCTGKATAPCTGIQFEVQTNPMKPCKSVVWKRCSVPEPGRAVEAEDAEDVPYVLLYFTVSHFSQLHHPSCMFSLHGVGICISVLWLPHFEISL